MSRFHIVIFGCKQNSKELYKEIRKTHPDWYVARVINEGAVFDGEGNELGKFDEETLAGLRQFIPTTIHLAFLSKKAGVKNTPQLLNFFAHRFVKIIEYEEGDSIDTTHLISCAEKL